MASAAVGEGEPAPKRTRRESFLVPFEAAADLVANWTLRSATVQAPLLAIISATICSSAIFSLPLFPSPLFPIIASSSHPPPPPKSGPL